MRWLRWRRRRAQRRYAGVVVPPGRVVLPPPLDPPPRVVLGFRDGSTVDVPVGSEPATELREVAEVLIGRSSGGRRGR